MRKWLIGTAMLAVVALISAPVSASPLTEKQQETSFSASFQDIDNFGKTIQIDGEWQWILGKGYHEVGAILSYLKDDPDTGPSSDATIIGPSYTFNWMPANDKVTPFVHGAFGFVSGDLGDVFDNAFLAGIGAKVFVGDSGAVRFEYYFQRFMGADSFDDQDSQGLRIGISIFFGKSK
jgi:hypothetical protein